MPEMKVGIFRQLLQGELHDLVIHHQPQLRSPTVIVFTSLGLPYWFVLHHYAVLVTIYLLTLYSRCPDHTHGSSLPLYVFSGSCFHM